MKIKDTCEQCLEPIVGTKIGGVWRWGDDRKWKWVCANHPTYPQFSQIDNYPWYSNARFEYRFAHKPTMDELCILAIEVSHKGA